jgi:hypothetical protein
MAKVRIKKVPGYANGGSSRMFGDQTPPVDKTQIPGKSTYHGGNDPEIKVRRTLQPTSKENATLEAELGETVVTDLNGQGIPEFYSIGGKPHSKGGTPLNLPPESFIFSKDKKLNINDPEVLKMFNKKSKGKKGFSPAEISKSYNLNVYREILANPNSDRLQRETAELMITNYNNKLGALALAQESIKGFDNGIPSIAIPYMESVGMDPETFINPEMAPSPEQVQVAMQGAETYKAGGSLQKFQGGGSKRRKRKVRVVQTPTMSTRTTRKTNIPKGTVVWDPNKPGYDESDLREGEYVLQPNGTYKKVVGYTAGEYGGRDVSELEKEGLGENAEAYGRLENKINSSPKLQAALVARYKESLKDVKPQGRLTQEHIDAMGKLSDAEIVSNYLRGNKQNMIVNSKVGGIDPETGESQVWDKGWNEEEGVPNKYKEISEQYGIDMMDPAQTGAFQLAYNSMQELTDDPEFKAELKNYKILQTGHADELYKGSSGEKMISKIDGWMGDTTIGQMQMYKPNDPTFEDVPQEDVEAPIKHLPEAQQRDPAKWWTQDVLNIGNAATDFLGVKKYAPWQATPEFEAATPAFTDFRGTAARINAGVQGAGQQAALFAGPQAYAANLAQIAGKSINPILQAQEAEIRANQNIANQFEQFNVSAKNQYNFKKAALDTNLFDKATIANQQYDNSKRAFRHNLVNAFNQGWTNKGKTQVMNQDRPNYYIDPATGYKHFTGTPGQITPNNVNSRSAEEELAAIKYRNPDWSPQLIESAYKLDKNLPTSTSPAGVRMEDLGPPMQ